MVFSGVLGAAWGFWGGGEGMGLLWLQLWGFLCKFVDY